MNIRFTHYKLFIMKYNFFSKWGGVALAIFMLPFLYSCEQPAPEINYTYSQTVDYSHIVDAIKDMSAKLADIDKAIASSALTLAQKLDILEAAVQKGILTQSESYQKLVEAIKATGTTMEEKLNLLMEALNAQSTTLSGKIGILEEAVRAGIVAEGENAELLAKSLEEQVKAIKAQTGTIEAVLDSISTIIANGNTELSTKLVLLEAALKAGITSQEESAAQMIKAIESLAESNEEKMDAITAAIGAGVIDLSTKLALIEATTKSGLSSQIQQLNLLRTAILSGNTTISDKLQAIKEAYDAGLVSQAGKLDLIKGAIDALATASGTTNDKLTALVAALSETGDLAIGIKAIAAAVETGLASDGDLATLIKQLMEALNDEVAAQGMTFDDLLAEVKASIRNGSVSAVDLSILGTANCYIVEVQGKYKFPTVQGNSNTTVGTVESVEVLWESFGTDVAPMQGDLITNVAHEAGWISFSASNKKGNAVIAARDNTGKILWSWHIWMTDKPVDQVYRNSAGTMMDRNLGATSATPGDPTALGLFYQWGRKDPFLGAKESMYDYDYNIFYPFSIMAASFPPSPFPEGENITTITDIGYTIAHPTTLLRISGELYTNDGDWDKDKTAGRWNSTKAIYDPCPVGYKVPEIDVFRTAAGENQKQEIPFDFDNLGVDFGANSEGSIQFSSASDVIVWYPSTGLISEWGRFRPHNISRCWTVSDNGGSWRYVLEYHSSQINTEPMFDTTGGGRPVEGNFVRCQKE